MPTSTRERLVAAAYALFDERGYDATTVETIAERAGVGRTTFFRAFRSKDDVVQPDHDTVLAAVTARLAAAPPDAAPPAVATAVSEAAHLVMRRYLDEGDLARARYRLTRTVPSLRQREVAGLQRYQQAFRAFLRGRVGPATDVDLSGVLAEVRAEVLAAGVVTAHNHVLRRWLREETDAPVAELDAALGDVLRVLAGPAGATGTGRTRVVVLETDAGVEEVLPALRSALDELSPSPDERRPPAR